MKTRILRSLVHNAKILFTPLFAAQLLAGAQFQLHAGIVADGGTTNQTTSINLSPADLVVGTNAGNTTVNLLGPNGAVTNANGYIGFNASSTNNKVNVQNNGAIWHNSGTLSIGTNGAINSLVVSNGGTVINSGDATVGVSATSGTNVVVIAGSGSVWNSGSNLRVGGSGAGNQLRITAGGSAIANFSFISGLNTSSSSNQIMVSAGGSLLRARTEMRIGNSGPRNFLLITNGGKVGSSEEYGASYATHLGYFSGSSSNLVVVTGSGSLFTNGNLNIGRLGPGNTLRLQDGGRAATVGTTVLGEQPGSEGNLLHVAGGFLDAGPLLEVRRGTLRLDSGTTTATTLLANNGASSSIVFNGGTLITRGGTIDNGLTFGVGLTSGYPAAIWVVLSNSAPTTVAGGLNIGVGASDASLLITNGGTLDCNSSLVGQFGAEAARVIISGPNSRWNVNGLLDVGYGSGGASPSRFYITNGGTLFSSSCDLGHNPEHYTLISGKNSLWTNSGTMNVGADIASSDTFVTIGTGGTLADGGNVNIAGPNSILSVIGGGLLVDGTLNVRSGTLQLDSGTASAMTLWATNGANSSIVFNGGTLIARAATIATGQPFAVGLNSGYAPATFILASNAGPSSLDSLIVGDGAPNATVIFTNGSSIGGGNMILGNAGSSVSNTMVVSGLGTSCSTSGLTVGHSGANNLLVVSNGAAVTSGGLVYLGDALSSSNNTLLVTGPNSVWSANSIFYLGNGGSGNNLIVSNGARANLSLVIMGSSGTNNTVSVSGNGSHLEAVGQWGIGSSPGNRVIISDGATMRGYPYSVPSGCEFTIVNGAAVTNAGNTAFSLPGGTALISNATFQAATTIPVGLPGQPSRLTVAGNSALCLPNSLSIVSGTNVVNAGLLQTLNFAVSTEEGALEMNGGQLTANGTLACTNGLLFLNGGIVTVSNSYLDSGSAVVAGNGSSQFTYQMTGNGTHRFRQGLIVTNNARLTGNGAVVGANAIVANTLTVLPGGVVYPGNHIAIGRIVLSNSPSLSGNIVMDISKNGSVLTNDQLQVIAPLTYGGNLSVSGNLLTTPLALGDSFKLFSANSYAGNFSSVSVPTPPPGLMWTNRLLVDGTLAIVPLLPPKITSVTQSGTNLILNVTSYGPGMVYTLYTSTNAALPMASWTPVFSNVLPGFDPMGNETITNVINVAEPQRYYRIYAGYD